MKRRFALIPKLALVASLTAGFAACDDTKNPIGLEEIEPMTCDCPEAIEGQTTVGVELSFVEYREDGIFVKVDDDKLYTFIEHTAPLGVVIPLERLNGTHTKDDGMLYPYPTNPGLCQWNVGCEDAEPVCERWSYLTPEIAASLGLKAEKGAGDAYAFSRCTDPEPPAPTCDCPDALPGETTVGPALTYVEYRLNGIYVETSGRPYTEIAHFAKPEDMVPLERLAGVPSGNGMLMPYPSDPLRCNWYVTCKDDSASCERNTLITPEIAEGLGLRWWKDPSAESYAFSRCEEPPAPTCDCPDALPGETTVGPPITFAEYRSGGIYVEVALGDRPYTQIEWFAMPGQPVVVERLNGWPMGNGMFYPDPSNDLRCNWNLVCEDEDVGCVRWSFVTQEVAEGLGLGWWQNPVTKAYAFSRCVTDVCPPLLEGEQTVGLQVLFMELREDGIYVRAFGDGREYLTIRHFAYPGQPYVINDEPGTQIGEWVRFSGPTAERPLWNVWCEDGPVWSFVGPESADGLGTEIGVWKDPDYNSWAYEWRPQGRNINMLDPHQIRLITRND